MTKIGKVYAFLFGKEIFVMYIVIGIYSEYITLRRIEDHYCGAPLDIHVAPEILNKKKLIRNWNEFNIERKLNEN